MTSVVVVVIWFGLQGHHTKLRCEQEQACKSYYVLLVLLVLWHCLLCSLHQDTDIYKDIVLN